jgi:hypothetical protein
LDLPSEPGGDPEQEQPDDRGDIDDEIQEKEPDDAEWSPPAWHISRQKSHHDQRDGQKNRDHPHPKHEGRIDEKTPNPTGRGSHDSPFSLR